MFGWGKIAYIGANEPDKYDVKVIAVAFKARAYNTLTSSYYENVFVTFNGSRVDVGDNDLIKWFDFNMENNAGIDCGANDVLYYPAVGSTDTQ